MKPKRYYHRPPYKKMWLAMNDENDALRLEVTNLRKELKSVKMTHEADLVNAFGNNAVTPLYDQPKEKAWWQWW